MPLLKAALGPLSQPWNGFPMDSLLEYLERIIPNSASTTDGGADSHLLDWESRDVICCCCQNSTPFPTLEIRDFRAGLLSGCQAWLFSAGFQRQPSPGGKSCPWGHLCLPRCHFWRCTAPQQQLMYAYFGFPHYHFSWLVYIITQNRGSFA